jgi:uncharacterized protein YukE
MPTARIQAPDGRIITLEVPEGATEQQILDFVQSQDISQFQQTQQPAQDVSALDAISSVPDESLGTSEALLSLASGAVAEPIAGLAGLGASIFGDEQGIGAQTVEQVREALTFQPRTEAGQKRVGQIQDLLSPVTDAIQGAQSELGQLSFDAASLVTDDPELQAAAGAAGEAIPAALLEVVGFKGLKASNAAKLTTLPDTVRATVAQAAPTIKQIKDRSSQLYAALDNSSTRVRPQVFDNFVSKLSSDLAEQIDPQLHPKSTAVLNRLTGS